MAHAQKPYFVFRRNGRVHLNRQIRQFSRLLAAEVCASAVVMLDTPCSEVVWRVLATHSIHLFPLHYPSRASPCAINFQLDSTFRRILMSVIRRQCVRLRNFSQDHSHTHTLTHLAVLLYPMLLSVCHSNDTETLLLQYSVRRVLMHTGYVMDYRKCLQFVSVVITISEECTK